MVMTGTDIPSHPNGFNENLNFGANTQVYNKVSISTLASNFQVTTDLGTFNSTPDAGIVGMCDRATKSNTVSFTSTAVLIENVTNNGECFDITSTFNGFSQQGRGSISADGKTVTLEFFFNASGHRCADGAVGATGVSCPPPTAPSPSPATRSRSTASRNSSVLEGSSRCASSSCRSACSQRTRWPRAHRAVRPVAGVARRTQPGARQLPRRLPLHQLLLHPRDGLQRDWRSKRAQGRLPGPIGSPIGSMPLTGNNVTFYVDQRWIPVVEYTPFFFDGLATLRPSSRSTSCGGWPRTPCSPTRAAASTPTR